VPVSKLFGAFKNARIRKRWLPDKLRVRSANLNKAMSIKMEDETTVALGFLSKGAKKSAVAIQHSKLRDKASAQKMKAWWSERFDALADVLK
jgi:hypothetical protein